MQCDPIEKKPFFHARPGALAYSFGMLGCDLHCSYCQNWVTSQALRDPGAVSVLRLDARPGGAGHEASRLDARVIVSTYNEPLITSEWAVAIFKAARAAGLMTAYVSNGNGTPRVLEYIRPWIDLYKVDLKSFDDRHYRQLGGRLAPILETIRALHAMEIWLELVTLLIPGFNDSDDELTRLTAFVARSHRNSVARHRVSQDYRMHDPANTTPEMLLRAVDIARAAGLRYVYAGNLPGQVGDLEDTRCHNCSTTLIERSGYYIQSYRLTADGSCPACGTTIPGRWAKALRRADRVDAVSARDAAAAGVCRSSDPDATYVSTCLPWSHLSIQPTMCCRRSTRCHGSPDRESS